MSFRLQNGRQAYHEVLCCERTRVLLQVRSFQEHTLLNTAEPLLPLFAVPEPEDGIERSKEFPQPFSKTEQHEAESQCYSHHEFYQRLTLIQIPSKIQELHLELLNQKHCIIHYTKRTNKHRFGKKSSTISQRNQNDYKTPSEPSNPGIGRGSHRLTADNRHQTALGRGLFIHIQVVRIPERGMQP